ncbi:MAG TPA: XdhC family protein [Burkholderiales bacterium]|nr:XdhC family protein [Burkholderiales bacterium]
MRPELLALAARLSAQGERFALVTVVRREPPSSARVGDTALVTEGGGYHGWAGGGCTRETVVREAQRAMAEGEPRFLSLSPDAAAESAPRARPGMVALPMTCDSGGTVEIYVEPVLPVPRLFLFGASPAVRCLARIAHAMGYRVDVVHPDADQGDFPDAQGVQKTFASETLPRGAHVLVATMGDDDLEVLRSVLAREPAYVGVIASRKRFETLRAELLQRGVPEAALVRVAAPAGLDLGARTPEEIALSVMAQIVQARRKPIEATPAEAVDPVCGMTVAVAGARHTASVGGVVYYFCCAGCRSKFLQVKEDR